MAEIIIVGVDDSQSALRAAEQAAVLAAGLGAELYVVSAFNVSVTEVTESARYQGDPIAMANALNKRVGGYRGEAERIASTVADTLHAKVPKLTITSKAVEGTPAAALLQEAEQLDADVIVVGNKRVQGPAKILGSIARTVAGEANCDLYVVNTHPR